MTYKAIGRSCITYGCPAWSPIVSDSSWQALQRSQNTALRIATGAHQMADNDHIHRETKEMTVKKHSEMISTQFNNATQFPFHPCHRTHKPGRLKKQTLASKYDNIGSARNMTLQSGTKWLHTDCVKKCLASYGPNKVLHSRPPDISAEEADLPRNVRTKLCQLRSGYSLLLNSYRHRIDPSIADKCPNCNQSGHTTEHLLTAQVDPRD